MRFGSGGPIAGSVLGPSHLKSGNCGWAIWKTSSAETFGGSKIPAPARLFRQKAWKRSPVLECGRVVRDIFDVEWESKMKQFAPYTGFFMLIVAQVAMRRRCRWAPACGPSAHSSNLRTCRQTYRQNSPKKRASAKDLGASRRRVTCGHCKRLSRMARANVNKPTFSWTAIE